MESTARYGRALQAHLSSSLKQRRSGYEPSDTETELPDSPWREADDKTEVLNQYQELNVLHHQDRDKSPLKLSRSNTIKIQNGANSPQRDTLVSPVRRRHNRSNVSPFSRSELGRNHPDDNPKPDYESLRATSPFSRSERPRYNRGDVKPDSDSRRSMDPFSISEQRRHVSPYRNNASKVSEVSNYNRRAASAPRARLKEYESLKLEGDKEKKRVDRNLSPLPRNTSRMERDNNFKYNPSGGEINEMLANVKISKAPPGVAPTFESTDSIAPGDIFFSRDYAGFPMQNSVFATNGSTGSKFNKKPESYAERDPNPHQGMKGNYQFNQTQVNSGTSVFTKSSINNSTAISRQTSTLSDYSGRTNGSARKFAANRQKNQSEKWFSCIKKGSCRTSKRSPEKETELYEATVIEKAFVLESLRQFWADKHQPGSLSGFTCHKQEAVLLKQLVSVCTPFSFCLGSL